MTQPVRSFVPVLLRDLAITAATIALAVLDAHAGRQPGLASVALGVLTGTMIAVTGYLLHEWGHWAFAVASGAHVFRPASRTPLLFHLDADRSTRRQFLWMSAGGYLASLAGVAIVIAWADLATTSGIVAVVLTIAGMIATLVLEVPTTWRVARGAPIPTGPAVVRSKE